MTAAAPEKKVPRPPARLTDDLSGFNYTQARAAAAKAGFDDQFPDFSAGWVGAGRPATAGQSAAYRAGRLAAKPSGRKSFDPSEERDESGKWTAGGGGGAEAEPADAPATPPKGRRPRDPDFVGDPLRDAAHKFADDVNGRIEAATADAKAGAKQIVREAPKAYREELAKLKDSQDGQDLAAADKAAGAVADAMPDEQFGAMSAEEKAAFHAKVHEAALAAIPEDRRAALAEKYDVGQPVDELLAPDAAAAASASVYDGLTPTQQAAILPDGPDQLYDDMNEGDAGDVSRDALDERAEDYLSDLRPDAIAGSLESVPSEYRAYIDAHTTRIEEAVNEHGKLNADKVFAETDDEVPAIPVKAAAEVARKLTADYAAEVEKREAPLREAGDKATAAFEVADPDQEDDDAVHAAAIKAATDAGIGPDHNLHDLFVEELSEQGAVSEDATTLADDERADIASDIVKAAAKSAPKSARARLKFDAESLAETLAGEGSVPADYFHAEYLPPAVSAAEPAKA